MIIDECKKDLASEFGMKDLGLKHEFIGLEVWKRLNDIFLIQGKYMANILKRLSMMDSKSMTTPMDKNLKNIMSDYALNSYLVDAMMYR